MLRCCQFAQIFPNTEKLQLSVLLSTKRKIPGDFPSKRLEETRSDDTLAL